MSTSKLKNASQESYASVRFSYRSVPDCIGVRMTPDHYATFITLLTVVTSGTFVAVYLGCIAIDLVDRSWFRRGSSTPHSVVKVLLANLFPAFVVALVCGVCVVWVAGLSAILSSYTSL